MEESKRVLVVDDSASVRWELRSVLEKLGLTVVEAENGVRGLAALDESAPIHMMIVDVNMPVMDGLEMIRRARAMRKHASTPIFVLTTEAGPRVVKDGKSAGATAWIIKPVKPETLIAGVRTALRL
jgi:two-component system chemotaxis response regulator CheY